MAKPIEKGCRAVVVNSRVGNNGIVVTVIGKAPDDHTFRPSERHNIWYVDKKLKGHATDNYNCPEYYLKRIDDYDGDEKSSWEAMKDIWTPEQVEA